MRLKISFLMMAIVALIVSGCRDWFPPVDPNDPDPKPDTTATGGDLRNVKWCLTQFSGDPMTTEPRRPIYLVFGEGDSLTGFTGCNYLWGSYATSANGGLSFGDIVTTKMWCDDNGLYEARFLDALQKATSYSVDAGRSSLRIYYGTGNTYMLFQRCDSIGTPGGGTGTDSTGSNYELGDTIMLRIKTAATISSENLTIRFPVLLEESRCPIESTCLWDGNAKVMVDLAGAGAIVSMELNTGLEPKSGKALGYKVELIDVLPRPSIYADPNPDGYIAVLRVTKN